MLMEKVWCVYSCGKNVLAAQSGGFALCVMIWHRIDFIDNNIQF